MRPPDAPVASGAETIREMAAIRAGMLVLIGTAAANVSAYAFHLVSARMLGPAPYGELASLVALAGLIALPLSGVQLVVARYTAAFLAQASHDDVRALFYRGLVLTGAVAAVVTAVLLAATPLIQRALDIESPWPVVFTGLLTLPAALTPVAWGVSQGLQRFALLAGSMSLGSAIRVGLAAVLLGVGFGPAGAVGATVVGSFASLALVLWFLRRWLSEARNLRPPISWTDTHRYLLPIVVALLALTSLSTLDVLVAKIALPESDAGVYGALSLTGRVILYLPTVIVTVMLPKVSARTAANRDTSSILARSLAVTVVFCAAATLAYSAAPEPIVRAAFGAEFTDGSHLLWLFAVAMSGYSILNVLLAYHLGRGSLRLPWLLFGGAVLQAIGFAIFHESARELLGVSIVIAWSLVALHEVFIHPSLPHSAILLWRRASGSRNARKRSPLA
jgi:O-antigen/teichoic acid export membrane protein